ncbi:MAG: nickel pincer cofactor biosynthesis protein LarB [Bauldia sp.]|nr:nickel pincer cofactor biosynthesis protein LarB [Bauldia sp.]
MTDIRMDWGRATRTGVAEAVFCAGKSPAQIDAIVAAASGREHRLLMTRLDTETHAALVSETSRALDYDPISRTAILGGATPLVASGTGIVAAGTSDMPVALEAQRTLAFAGHDSTMIIDVGVAGLWRLVDRRDELASFRVIIAVAGMEGALFSVIGGLVPAPVIAVPTSVGYGVATGGVTALNAALSSCSPGVVVVNVDNGFGAAVAACKILMNQPSA